MGSRDDQADSAVPAVLRELRKAAAAFDGGQPGGPQPAGGPRLAARSDEGSTDWNLLLRSEAQHLRKMAALCSMAARELTELESWKQRGMSETDVRDALLAVGEFLRGQLRGPRGDREGKYVPNRPAGEEAAGRSVPPPPREQTPPKA